MTTEDAAGAEADGCREVGRVLEAAVMDDVELADARIVAPYAGPRAVRALLERLTGASALPQTALYDGYLALGLSRSAEALRLLRGAPRPREAPRRVARALGLLALGEGAESATVAAALAEGPVEQRRLVARGLSFMRQRRPQAMLWDALEDPDPEVRGHAAKVLVELGSVRARRVLLELARGREPALAARAARALVRSGHSLPGDALGALDAGRRLDQLVAEHARARRSSPTALLALGRSSDPLVRAAAYAALAAEAALPGHPALGRSLARLPEPAPPELLAARALAGDPAVLGALAALDAAGAGGAVRVLYAFGGAPARGALGAPLAAELARLVEGWMGRGLLEDRSAALALRALARLDAVVGLRVARARLAGGDGRGMRAALRVVGRSGAPADAAALVAVGRRLSGRTRAEAWRSAARVCR